MHAFEKLKHVLTSEDVLLMYPDFKKSFDLTTDASASGLGAVLSQEGRPIIMISRTLRGPEVNFATNERELLAIVWALRKLRDYLYGVSTLNIYTDHQPLTFAVSEKNPNAKIKRWKAFIDEHNANVFYKPGKENHVAYALSRQHINNLDWEINSDASTIHSEEYFTYTVNSTDNPVNCFRNQIIIQEAETPSVRTFIIFGQKRRHIIEFSNENELVDKVKEAVHTDCVNAIFCNPHVLALIQHELISTYPTTKFRYSKKFVADIYNKDEQKEIIITEHNRAHRAAQENVKQILLLFSKNFQHSQGNYIKL